MSIRTTSVRPGGPDTDRSTEVAQSGIGPRIARNTGANANLGITARADAGSATTAPATAVPKPFASDNAAFGHNAASDPTTSANTISNAASSTIGVATSDTVGPSAEHIALDSSDSSDSSNSSNSSDSSDSSSSSGSSGSLGFRVSLVLSPKQMEKLERVVQLVAPGHRCQGTMAHALEKAMDLFIKQNCPLERDARRVARATQQTSLRGQAPDHNIAAAPAETAPATRSQAEAERRHGKSEVDTKQVDTKTVDSERIDGEAPDTKSFDGEAVDDEASKSGRTDIEAVDSGRNDGEAGNSERKAPEAVDSEQNDAVGCTQRARDSLDPLPTKLRDRVLARDGGRCTFVGPGGHQCGATRRLEVDHIIPRGKGGETTAENLRTLCRAHNQFEADKAYGRKFMEQHRRHTERRQE